MRAVEICEYYNLSFINFECDVVFIIDTISTYAMRPIDIEKDNIDFCMASAQKGLMAMTGLSFVIGNIEMIRKSAGVSKTLILLQRRCLRRFMQGLMIR